MLKKFFIEDKAAILVSAHWPKIKQKNPVSPFILRYAWLQSKFKFYKSRPQCKIKICNGIFVIFWNWQKVSLLIEGKLKRNSSQLPSALDKWC